MYIYMHYALVKVLYRCRFLRSACTSSSGERGKGQFRYTHVFRILKDEYYVLIIKQVK